MSACCATCRIASWSASATATTSTTPASPCRPTPAWCWRAVSRRRWAACAHCTTAVATPSPACRWCSWPWPCKRWATSRARAEALALGLGLGRQRQEWLADYGSPLRDQALIYALLEEHDLAAGSLTSCCSAWPRRALQDYLSTQERNALFLAGRGLIKTPEKSWNAVLEAGGQVRELSNGQPALKLEGASLSEPLSLSTGASPTSSTSS